MTTAPACPRCGAPLVSGACGSCDERAFRVVRRDIAILVLLSIAVVPAYLFTRSAAERNRTTDKRIAAEWFRKGREELERGNPEAAMESLRQAAVRDRDSKSIALAFARVLVAAGRDGEARTALLRLRERAPGDPEIALELARLETRGGNVPDALLHYHQALYGSPGGEEAGRTSRAVRLELVRFLLDHGEASRAQSELIVLAADAPADAAAHVQLAGLFLEAGDERRALAQYLEAARLDERSAAAFAGAGKVAFLAGDYSAARRHLERAVRQDPGAAEAARLLETTRLIRTADPLAPRIPFAERTVRLRAAVEQAARRIESCLESRRGALPPLPSLGQLLAEVEALGRELGKKRRRPDPDLVQNGADVVFRVEEETSRACGEPEGLDLALLLIGRRHAGAGS